MLIRLICLQCRQVFCKIRCPLDRLIKYCDECDYKLLLDKIALKAECLKGREVSNYLE